MSALPGDCIIEVSGEMYGVRKAISLLSEHFCRFLFDDSLVDLFFIEPVREINFKLGSVFCNFIALWIVDFFFKMCRKRVSEVYLQLWNLGILGYRWPYT
jgi:hypothetical protein